MKNKSLTIALLSVVIFIWGWILYKFYKDMNNSDNRPAIQKLTTNLKNESVTVIDYTIHTYERDPFLSVFEDTITNPEPEIKHESVIKKPLTLPEFNGVIINHTQSIAILKAGNKFFFLKEGESINGMKIKSIQKDSIIIIANAERIGIKLYKNQQKNLMNGTGYKNRPISQH